VLDFEQARLSLACSFPILSCQRSHQSSFSVCDGWFFSLDVVDCVDEAYLAERTDQESLWQPWFVRILREIGVGSICFGLVVDVQNVCEFDVHGSDLIIFFHIYLLLICLFFFYTLFTAFGNETI
jgi:hypothetical protein